MTAQEKNSNRISVTFWGTRGSIPTPGSGTEKYGGNTPCVFCSCGNTGIIIDAGTGINNLGQTLVASGKDLSELNLHLLLSHTHWDHIQGLPFFAPAYVKGTKLTIYGSPQKERFLETILKGQMDINYFPVDMNAFAAEMSIVEIAENIKLGPITVEWQEQIRHPGGSVRYALKASGKKIVYASDVELDTIFCEEQTPENVKLGKEYRAFVHGADLLIADAQYTEEEYASKRGKFWGHTSIPTIISIAAEEKVKQLALFHHDPQHSDTMLDRLWSKYAKPYAAQSSKMNVFWAREGMTLAI